MTDIDLLPESVKEKILHAIGKDIVAKAKRLAPIDTGLLRSKITYKLEGNRLIISTEDVEYAEFLEYGTSNIKIGTPAEPRKLDNGTYLPFIRTAIYRCPMANIVKQVLKGEQTDDNSNETG